MKAKKRQSLSNPAVFKLERRYKITGKSKILGAFTCKKFMLFCAKNIFSNNLTSQIYSYQSMNTVAKTLHYYL